jgi:hypothetical protein
MSKTIDTLVQNQLDSKDYAAVLLARFHWDAGTPHFGPLRLTNAMQNIYWDEEGAGEEEYIGLGNLVSVSPIPEVTELSGISMQFTLSGIPNNLVTGVFDKDAYQNNPCYVWYAVVDKQTYAVEGGQTGPILVFAGLMDYCTFEFGQTATINLTASSRLADWERPRGGRYNQSYQQNYIDASDYGFEWVKPLQDLEIRFGGSSVLDPGGGSDLGGGGSSGSQNPDYGYDLS